MKAMAAQGRLVEQQNQEQNEECNKEGTMCLTNKVARVMTITTWSGGAMNNKTSL